jgi:hypothetical protein
MPRRAAGLAFALVAAGCIDFAPPDPFNPENPFDRTRRYLWSNDGVVRVHAELEQTLSGASDDGTTIARLGRAGIGCVRVVHLRCTYVSSMRLSITLGAEDRFAAAYVAEIEPARPVGKVVQLCITTTILNHRENDPRPKVQTDCYLQLPPRKTSP